MIGISKVGGDYESSVSNSVVNSNLYDSGLCGYLAAVESNKGNMPSLKLPTFYAIFLVATILIVTGCATTEQFTKKYPGYTVVAKERKEATQDVPVWIMSCVTPNGGVRCQVKATGSYPNPGVNSCTLSCDHKHGDSWSKRQIRTTNETYFIYVVRLQSPTGEIVEDKVTSSIFNEIREAQVFPTAASK